jgi:Transposase DDE domain group 1
VSQAGALLLTETARITGLAAGLSGGLVRWRPSRAVHDPGTTVLDLAVAVALGGDCLADAGVLRAEPALFGLVAPGPLSDPAGSGRPLAVWRINTWARRIHPAWLRRRAGLRKSRRGGSNASSHRADRASARTGQGCLPTH